MKFISAGLALVCVAILISAAVLRQRSQTLVSAADRERGPVIVELFTSEGCSSCPPADAALAKLEENQATANAEVIGLEEHVDYWNQLGWTDPFSSPEWTSRQQEYAEVFGSGSVYTPQMVVDGTTELVGSRGPEVRRSIEQAARRVKTMVTVVANGEETAGVKKFDVRVGKLAGAEMGDDAEVWMAVTESGLHSSVTRGENAGEELRHASVVRSLQKLGAADKRQEISFAGEPAVPVSSSWKRENLRVVVFVQEKKSRHILGASAAPFADRAAIR
jgi:hypothetical protein